MGLRAAPNMGIVPFNTLTPFAIRRPWRAGANAARGAMAERQTNIHRADLYARVRKQDGTWASIARRAGLTRSAVCRATVRPVPAANAAIAAFLGTTVHALWPEWFDANGVRRASHMETLSTC